MKLAQLFNQKFSHEDKQRKITQVHGNKEFYILKASNEGLR